MASVYILLKVQNAFSTILYQSWFNNLLVKTVQTYRHDASDALI